jgi:hypothetical protein
MIKSKAMLGVSIDSAANLYQAGMITILTEHIL